MVQVSEIYFGRREAMIAEVAAWDPMQIGVAHKECKYLVLPMGDAQFDVEWFGTKAFAIEHAKYIASHYDGCKVVSI